MAVTAAEKLVIWMLYLLFLFMKDVFFLTSYRDE